MVFDDARNLAWPYRYECRVLMDTIAGGTPVDEKVVEGWLKTKLVDKRDDLIRTAVAQTMVETGSNVDDAVKKVSEKHLTVFKRDARGLYVEGRQIKAAIKEAASVAAASGKLPLRSWGITRKFLVPFVAEHIFVEDKVVHLYHPDSDSVFQPDETEEVQQFVHTYQGSAMHYKEYVTGAELRLTVLSDWPFTQEEWAMIWLTGEMQGIGSSRSAGFGRYRVTRWASVGEDADKAKAKVIQEESKPVTRSRTKASS